MKFTRSLDVPLTLNVMRSGTSDLYNRAGRAPDGRHSSPRAYRACRCAGKRENPHIVFSAATYEILRRWPDFTKDRLGVADRASRLMDSGVLFGGTPSLPDSHRRASVPLHSSRLASASRARRPPRRRRRGTTKSASRHDCAACANACMIEMNRAVRPGPAGDRSLSRAYLLRDIN